jgi:hypothetical protein
MICPISSNIFQYYIVTNTGYMAKFLQALIDLKEREREYINLVSIRKCVKGRSA